MEGSSLTECDDVDWILYKDRPEWNDVKPVEQNDGLNPVVAIAYSDKFRDVFDYFRAILKSQEKSERALDLTKDASELNPANYTVWQYRRELLKILGKDLKTELKYVSDVIEEHPKNYQVWHHRRVLIEWLDDPINDLQFTANILAQDPKNYHAWQYRQWIIRTFNLFEKELNYVEMLISDDIRNNSAWNQRYFVLNHTTEFSPESLEDEIKYTLAKIQLVSKNESAWNYLRGVLLHHKNGLHEPTVINFCKEMYEKGNRSPHLLEYLVDLALCNEPANDETQSKIEQAMKLCDELAEEYDIIRCKYWQFLKKGLKEKLK